VERVPLELGIVVAAALFVIGFTALLLRNNILFTLISIEVMFNAAGFAFIIAGAKWRSIDGQVMFLFILAIAAAEVAVGLALVFLQDHRFKKLETDTLSNMRG
jgi:NADH-quinone oxidoreductase subunit K